MKIRIKAPYPGAKSSGIYGADAKEIEIGTEITVKEEPTGWAGRYDVIDSSEAKEKGGKTLVVNPADAKAPFEAKEKGGGWWTITDADGSTVGKSIKKEDAELFNSSSDAEKAAYVANLKAE